MATLYIHIGTPKTGTSSIQNFLVLNEETMKKHGICHPRMELDFPKEKYKSRRNGHFLVYRSENTGMQKKYEEENIYQNGFEIIKNEAKTYKKIVITDEAIWYRQNHRKDFWESVKKDAETVGCSLKVIVYLRRQDLYMQALWNQSVKWYPRITNTFQEFLRSDAVKVHNMDYYEKLCHIANIIGKENLTVRSFEKNIFIKSKNGIYQDFLNAIDEPMKNDYLIPEENKNDSISGNFIEIKRLMNQVPEYQQMTDFLCEPVKCANEIVFTEPVSYYQYEEQIKFLQQFQKSNESVAKEFLGRENGVLFEEPVKQLPEWKINQDSFYKDIIYAFTEIAVKQQKEIISLKEEINMLKHPTMRIKRKLKKD